MNPVYHYQGPPPERAYFQGHETRRWIRPIIWVGGGCTFFSAVVTLRGLSQLTGEVVVPIGLTLLSAIISFLMFAFLCRTVPRASAQQRGPLLLGVAVPAMILVAATSTIMGLQGIAGPEAQLLDQQRIARAAERRLQDLREERVALVQTIDTLKAQETQFGGLATDETRDGRLSGRQKEGKVSYDLKAIADAFGTSAILLSQNLERRKQAEQQAAQAAATMRQIAQFTDASPAQMSAASAKYVQQLRIFNEALTQLEERIDKAEVLGPVRSALAQQALTPVTSKTEEGRLGQRAAATAVTRLGEQALGQAEQALERQEPTWELEEEDPFQIPRPMESIKRHFWAVVHLAAYPLAFDFLYPIVALIALSLMHVQVRTGSSGQGAPSPTPASPSTFHQEIPHGHLASPTQDPLQERLDEFNRHHRNRRGREPTIPQ